MDALYWGPFAMQKTNRVLGPEVPFNCTISDPGFPLISENSEAWRIEIGIRKEVKLKLRLESAEKDERVYKEKLCGKDHLNYFGRDLDGNPVIVSVSKEVKSKGENSYATVIRSKVHDLFGYMQVSSSSKVIKRINVISPHKYKDINWKQIKEPEIVPDLINFEESQITKNYKFGILYVKEGQTQEEDMFANVNTSKKYENFLLFLGDQIELKGWKGFRGGLDTKNGCTGTHSVYTKYQNYDIMFHVASLLPHSSTDLQQLERKRHLGNDVALIIFYDNNKTPFIPGCINSEFNHIFIVVQAVKGEKYRISVVCKKDVPPFGPAFPANGIFEKTPLLRDFLLTLLINGERAAMFAPDFSNKLSRTREALLREILDKFNK